MRHCGTQCRQADNDTVYRSDRVVYTEVGGVPAPAGTLVVACWWTFRMASREPTGGAVPGEALVQVRCGRDQQLW